MANGTSKVQDAQTKMTSFTGSIEEARETVQEWIEHLEAEKERLLAMMDGSHQNDVAALIAVIDHMLEELRKGDELLAELADKGAEVEARL